MAQDHHQPGVKPLGRELDAPYQRGGDDVAGDPDHKEIAESLVEDDLGRDPGIGAAEDDGEWLLPFGQLRSAGLMEHRRAAADAGVEAEIAGPESGEGFVGRDHGGRVLPRRGGR